MLSLKKVQQFRQPPLQQYISPNENHLNLTPGTQLLGGIFQDTRHVWHAKGASLEVRDTKTGCKVGGWVFGCILKDSNTKIVAVEEITRPHGRLSLLAVGLECTISGSVICFFDVFSSKVVRAIQINEKITTLHVIDPGIEDLNLPGPLRNFDGILSIGTQGGHVFLIDMCRQICEESLHSPIKRDELNPSQLVLLTSKNITKIEHYKEKSVRDSNHLAINLNAVFESHTEHFTLKGPKGDDRIHVNKEEVLTSGLYYCPQLTSLLVGYNFGAFQLWDLTTLLLVYTSPVCDEHLPVNRFALQEPADDPRAFCYIWVSYSNTEQYQSGLPFAVMYSVCYESKEYHEGYGYLYQDFQYCAVRFQVELGSMDVERHTGAPKGGHCLGFQPITKLPANKDPNTHSISGDTLALCLIIWSVWHSRTEIHTYTLLFDLNQWYKEQMPSFTKWKNCANYILKLCPSDVQTTGNKSAPVLDIAIDKRYLRQFVGVQRLEEHFHPTALSFDLWVLRDNEVLSVHNEGVQHLLLSQIEATGPLCLIKPSAIARQVLTLGLQPLFVEDCSGATVEAQREIILNVGLEHQLLGWLCKCAEEWANGSFASAGCSLEFLVRWAFQRAVALKSNCDRYCSPLFDYSQVQLDGNTASLLNSCVRQINNLCTFYSFVSTKLANFLACPEVVEEQHRSLQMVSVYFEVLQWLVNIGLLPECPPSSYPRQDNPDRISAPYPVQDLIKFYDEKRAQLKSSADNFSNEESLLFIDNLVHRKCGGARLQRQWQDDGGSGLYPPPSLQSLIRSYLIEGAGIGHKHSLVIYLFLDLAMALDQNKYSPVITYLIKFPAVFKVSTSSIKITQAFWQLDHGDFTTALEHLLDPFVLGEDLQDWHHTIIMRSLCVQKQYNFALLYLQTVRPPMTQEKDILTAISLFVANKMLDEAFYFMKQHHNNYGDRLLVHFFNECGKNDTLHDLLYKKLSSTEESSFIGFLKRSAHPASDELQVFYYLLRSRFLEAFDFHAGKCRRKPDRQGLIGQNDVSRADQVVRIFKSLLPDVSKKLVDYVRREKENLWREVQKPTPLSVFVHNTDEQIKYKSTLIHAALAKAKQTDSIDLSERHSGVYTEDTPFLRTPRACKSSARLVTPVITPKVVDLGEEDGASPAKILKLSPRTPTFSPRKTPNASVHSMMLTPIVKRKTSALTTDLFDPHTPQSILKGRHLTRYTESSTNEITIGDELDDIVRDESSSKKTAVGLQARRPLSRTARQHVQFDIATRVSSSFSDQSSRIAEITSLEDQILHGSSVEGQNLQRSSLSSRDLSSMISTKDSTNSTSEEAFYSPDTSISEEVTQQKEEVAQQQTEESVMQSPRARRSYKRSHKEMSPVRSSPRLAKLSNAEPDQTSSTEPSQTDIPSTTDESMQSPRPLQKLKGRKSLSRQVLEHNAFSQLQTSMTKNEKTAVLEKSQSSSKVTTLEAKLHISEVSSLDPKSPISNNSRNVTSNVSRRSVLESDISFDSDTSIGSDILLQEQPKMYVPEIPEWLNEFAASLRAKKKIEIAEPVPVEESAPIQEPADEFEPPVDVEESHIEIEKQPNEDQVVNEVEQKFDNETKRSFDNDKSREVISMEIYDDLSCGSEASCPENENVDHSGFNELELNVFDLNTPNQHRTTQSSIESFHYSVPEADMALIEDSPEKPEDQAIIILSSEEESVHSEESGSHEDINVSFERNIYEADYSTDQSSRDDEPDDDIQKEFGSSNSSTEKWGSVDQEDIEGKPEADVSAEEEVEAAEQLLEPVEDQQVVTDQDGLASVRENGDSSSSSTEKWNFSDREEVNENSEAESSREEEQILEPVEVEAVNQCSEDDANLVSMEDIRTERFEEVQSTVLAVSEDATLKAEVAEQLDADSEKSKNANEEELATSFVASEDQNSIFVAAKQISVSEEEQSAVPHLANNEEELATSRVASEVISEKSNKTSEEEQSTGPLVSNNEEELATSLVAPEHQFVAAKQISEVKDVGSQVISEESNKTTEEEQSAVPPVAENEHNPKLKITTTVETEPEVDKSTAKKETSIDSIVASSGKSNIEKDVDRKKDQSTNTTLNETAAGPRPERRFKSSRDSSSDTTLDGDAGAEQILVTAQVHTPSQHRAEEPLIRRVTRRNSLLLSQTVDGDITPSIFDDTRQDSKANMDVSSSDDVIGAVTPSTPTKTKTRAKKSSQSSDIIDCQSSTSKETIMELKVTAFLRRTRSASVDDVKTYSRKRSLQRSNSVNEKHTENSPKPLRGKGKALSVSHMPPISEERSGKKTYATARRLTRSQASMVKDIEGDIDVDDGNDSDKTIQLDDIDPIGLLDKESYHGEQDPEEKKIYEGSSPSNSTISSFTRPTRRKSRSVSVASDISLPLSSTESVTPEKKTTRKYGSGMKTRLRKQSESSLVGAEKSEPATPPKRTRKKAQVPEAEMSKPRTTRSRGNSVSSAKSDSSISPRKSTRSRRVIPTKSDLPGITEEKNNDVNATPSQKRQSRKRKSP